MSWPVKKLGDVLQISRGGSPRPIDNYLTEDESGLNWIKIGDVQVGAKYITQTKEKIRKEGLSKTREVKAGDFLLSNSMSFGRPYITKIDGCIHDGWLALRDKDNIFNTDFLYHVLTSNAVKEQFIKYASGAVVKNLNIDAVSKVVVAVPPLAEQQRIAELLDTADRILKLREQAIAKLDALAQSVFVDMFGDTTKNDRNWKVEKLSSLIKDKDTINYGVIQPGTEYENGVPLIRAGDVGNSNLNLSELKNIDPAIEANYKRSRLNGDEILVSCVGLIGAVMLANKSMKGFNIARAVARISPSSKVNRIYLSEYLKSPKVQRYFINELRTVAQPTLNIKQICETEVICPPIALQNDFAKIINQFDLVRKDYKQSLSKQLTFLRSLQHQSFAMN